MSLTPQAIEHQSKTAYRQWAEIWRKHAQEHSKFEMKTLADYENIGIGRAVLCVGNGYSLEREIETIKKYQDQVDILTCDKALGHLLNNGIKPKYVIVCDARVSAEKYLEPWKDQVEGITLFINVCANPEWTKAKWADVRFFCVMDVINTEKEFMAISGCPNLMAAATNVSNQMVVFLTQSDNNGRRNFFGYDKILLIGYDYSWQHGGKYYAFDEDGGGKANYMRHVYGRNLAGELCYTSNNLLFSSKWLEEYIKTFKLPVVQCTKHAMLSGQKQGVLAEQMQYTFQQEDQGKVRSYLRERSELLEAAKSVERKIRDIGRTHYLAYVASV